MLRSEVCPAMGALHERLIYPGTSVARSDPVLGELRPGGGAQPAPRGGIPNPRPYGCQSWHERPRKRGQRIPCLYFADPGGPADARESPDRAVEPADAAVAA